MSRHAAAAVSVVLIAIALTWMAAGELAREADAHVSGRLQTEVAWLARRAAPALADHDQLPALRAEMREIGLATGMQLTALGADGVPLADSHVSAGLLDNGAARPEIREARARGVSLVHRLPIGAGRAPQLVLARAVRAPDGALIGVVRGALPTRVRDAPLSRMRGRLAVALAIGLLLLGLLAIFVARGVARPIGEMVEVAERLAEGDVPQTPHTTRDDAIGALARALAETGSRMRERLDAIDAERTQLLAVLGGMVEGVIAVDRQERVLHINGVAAQILGARQDLCLGKPIWEVTRIPAITEALARTTADEPREVLLATPERGERRLSIYGAPLRNAARQQIGAVVVLHDVSELRRLENIRQEFVANVSHELKTPVAAISGLVETLLDDREMPAETQRRFLTKIRRQSERLCALIEDLLAISRLEARDAEQLGALREPCDLREPLAASIEHLRPMADARSLALSFEHPDEALAVNGERESLRRLVDNLLANAINYTPPDGRIAVRLTRDGDHAVLEVSDTGIGIDPVHQPRIFERFYRTDKARSRTRGGTGLGLAIVKHIALAHGGHVSLESTPDVGSTFRVQLPLAGPRVAGGPTHRDE